MRDVDLFRNFSRLFVSILFIFMGCWPVRAQTTPAQVAEQVTALLNFLKPVNLAAPGDLDDKNFDPLIEQLLRLRAAKKPSILEIEKVKISSSLLGSNFSTAFPSAAWPRDLIDEIKKAATYFDGLVFLRDPTQALLRRMDVLTASAQAIDMDDAAVQASVEALVKKLTAGKPTSARNQANLARDTLKGLLDDAAMKRVLIEDKDVSSKLAQLREALQPFAADKQLRVHIVSALYGDIGAINDILRRGHSVTMKERDRWCLAGAAVATSCERQTNCQANVDFKQALCGYDPAPLMASAYKGLVVVYQCRSNDDALWNDVDKMDYTKARIDRKFVPPPPTATTRLTLLYSKEQSFRCAPPLN
ncbi:MULTISPECIES: hypothetical protein [unclassified Mesorhizobium]|uniref:hypothetical protein n=1 Tax=unclassified Mesorhizobium TaxID=325217 RepID=UPI002417073D|nr:MULTISPECIES: hypothetical protein [unclassified Mesorhizobium]WFP61461.1 hypothetical protein QAZ47_23685 [Mesorhizobium sp. WSM4904]WFP74764.1 hypothetical protein QAZ22_23945 [Mesorhizobium sp. WSM4906]